MPVQNDSSNGSLERGHYDRLQFGPASTASNTGSRRSSVDFNVQVQNRFPKRVISQPSPDVALFSHFYLPAHLAT